MFWIIFTILWCLPGIYWAVERKLGNTPWIGEPLTPKDRNRVNIIELLSTFSWPLGYAFIYFSAYSFWGKLGILGLIHFLLLPFIQSSISAHTVKKQNSEHMNGMKESNKPQQSLQLKWNPPEYRGGNNWQSTFVLTEDENIEVQDFFNQFEDYKVNSKSADELMRSITAHGLYNYALSYKLQELGKTSPQAMLDMAIATISKAYSIFPLPMYIYDLASFTEMSGDLEKAKAIYRTFITLQKEFKPTKIQLGEISSRSFDIRKAVRDAKEKLKV